MFGIDTTTPSHIEENKSTSQIEAMVWTMNDGWKDWL